MKESLLGLIAQLTRDQKIALLLFVIGDNPDPNDSEFPELAEKLLIYGNDYIKTLPSTMVLDQMIRETNRELADLIFPQPHQDIEVSDKPDEEKTSSTLVAITLGGEFFGFFETVRKTEEEIRHDIQMSWFLSGAYDEPNQAFEDFLQERNIHQIEVTHVDLDLPDHDNDIPDLNEDQE